MLTMLFWVGAIVFLVVEIITLVWTSVWENNHKNRTKIDTFYFIWIFLTGYLMSWTWAGCFLFWTFLSSFASLLNFKNVKVGEIARVRWSLSRRILNNIDAIVSILFIFIVVNMMLK